MPGLTWVFLGLVAIGLGILGYAVYRQRHVGLGCIFIPNTDGKGVYVIRLTKGPLGRAGIQNGMKLVSVNGTQVATLPSSEVIAYFKRLPKLHVGESQELVFSAKDGSLIAVRVLAEPYWFEVPYHPPLGDLDPRDEERMRHGLGTDVRTGQVFATRSLSEDSVEAIFRS